MEWREKDPWKPFMVSADPWKPFMVSAQGFLAPSR